MTDAPAEAGSAEAAEPARLPAHRVALRAALDALLGTGAWCAVLWVVTARLGNPSDGGFSFISVTSDLLDICAEPGSVVNALGLFAGGVVLLALVGVLVERFAPRHRAAAAALGLPAAAGLAVLVYLWVFARLQRGLEPLEALERALRDFDPEQLGPCLPIGAALVAVVLVRERGARRRAWSVAPAIAAALATAAGPLVGLRDRGPLECAGLGLAGAALGLGLVAARALEARLVARRAE